MCLAVDYATTHPKSPSWKKGTRDGVGTSGCFFFLVDSRSNVLQYQSPLHPCIFSHCENTAHSYINRPFASASKLAAVRNIAQRYRLEDTTKRSEPCLSSNMSAMRAHHGGRSDEEGSTAAAAATTTSTTNSNNTTLNSNGDDDNDGGDDNDQLHHVQLATALECLAFDYPSENRAYTYTDSSVTDATRNSGRGVPI